MLNFGHLNIGFERHLKSEAGRLGSNNLSILRFAIVGNKFRKTGQRIFVDLQLGTVLDYNYRPKNPTQKRKETLRKEHLNSKDRFKYQGVRVNVQIIAFIFDKQLIYCIKSN